VQRHAEATAERFSNLVLEVLALLQAEGRRQGHPVPAGGPRYRWSPEGFDLESRAAGDVRPRWKLRLETLLGLVLFRTGWRFGAFEPGHYMRQTSLNTDYRKFDDGLRMTVDCSDAMVRRVEAILDTAEANGIVRFGMHRQGAALMTCIVPSVMTDDHLHFVDGASGGYAMAAQQMMAKSVVHV